MSAIYKIINPIVKGLLRSPAHRLMSHNTLVLTYTGRKSGREFSIPISYSKQDDALIAFTGKSGVWWRNFSSADSPTHARARIAGRDLDVTVIAVTEPMDTLAAWLSEFLRQTPRDARPSGVAMHDGNPDSADVKQAVQRLVALRIQI